MQNVKTLVLFLVWVIPGLSLLGQDSEPSGKESLLQYVRSSPYHGINYTVARSFGPEAVSILLPMLDDEKERHHWSNIVTVLGMIGDEKATEPLIQFLEKRFQGRIDDAAWSALLAVNTSLGFLAADPESEAFRYLRDGSRVESWRSRELKWTYPSLGDGHREILLAKLAINGLGISGNQAAAEHLRSLSERAKDHRDDWRYTRDNVSEALDLIDRIEREGHERVFGGDAF